MTPRQRLVLMANQIARNFATLDDAAAARATAEHMRSFWAPTMKTAIVDDGAGLSPVAAQAVALLRRTD